jgi:hypothetical protein
MAADDIETGETMPDREIFTANDLCLDMSIFRNTGEMEAVYDILKIDREKGRIWLTEFCRNRPFVVSIDWVLGLLNDDACCDGVPGRPAFTL